jgi:TusA-related sulfurtransferase
VSEGSELTIDSRGRRCPLPIIDLAAAARTAPAGSRITVIADDPAAATDVPAWCRMRGHHYEGSTPQDAAVGQEDSKTAMAYRVRLAG